MDVIYCMKCHNKKRGLNYENAKEQIAEALSIETDQIADGCPSFCGPGATHHFTEVDGEITFDQTFEGLLDKLREL